MGNGWKELGMQTAGNIVGAGMGLILGNHNDRRQRMQQDKLWQMEMKNRKEMTDYEQEKAYEMWLKTGPKGQMQQMKEAGLNPGLMYGMSGVGGATTGNGGGNVSGANAPGGGNEIISMMGMGQQNAMNVAQMELIKAQTEKTKAEADKTKGVDTETGKQGIEESKARIASLQQGITNAKAQEAMVKAETHLKNMQGQVQGATIQDQINQIAWNAKMAKRQLDLADNEQYISDATKDEKIAIFEAEATGAILRNALITEQTKATTAGTTNTRADTAKKGKEIEAIDKGMKLTDSQIKKIDEEIKQVTQNITNSIRGLDQKDTEIAINKAVQEFKLNHPGIGEVGGKMIEDGIEKVRRALGKPQNEKRETIDTRKGQN